MQRKLEEKEETVAFLLFLFACVGLQFWGIQGLGDVRQMSFC